MDVVANYAAGEEAVGAFFSCERRKGKLSTDDDEGPSQGPKKNKNKKKTWLFQQNDLDDDLLAAMERKRPRGPLEGGIFDKLLKEPCPYHKGGANHKHHHRHPEARPISNIRSEQAVLFFTNIIHRFGIPNVIITDNGTQFTGRKFLDFCDRHHIRVNWLAVAHPRTNGQVERANGMILHRLKPRIYNRLKMFGKKWVEELSSVLWSLRTTPSRATKYTRFFMVYGSEAVLATDLEYGSP